MGVGDRHARSEPPVRRRAGKDDQIRADVTVAPPPALAGRRQRRFVRLPEVDAPVAAR